MGYNVTKKHNTVWKLTRKIYTIYVHCLDMLNLFVWALETDSKASLWWDFLASFASSSNQFYIYWQCTYVYCVYTEMSKRIAKLSENSRNKCRSTENSRNKCRSNLSENSRNKCRSNLSENSRNKCRSNLSENSRNKRHSNRFQWCALLRQHLYYWCFWASLYMNQVPERVY